MKYCPYCGATLMGGVASFCAECGRSVELLSHQPEKEAEKQEKYEVCYDSQKNVSEGEAVQNRNVQEAPFTEESKKNAHSTGKLKKNILSKFGKRFASKKVRQIEIPVQLEVKNDGYDGYYDDICPLDNGHEREPLDPELIEKIITIAIGTVLIITIAIVIML